VPQEKKKQWELLIECIKKIREEQPGFAGIEEILAFLNTAKIRNGNYRDDKSVKEPSQSLFFSCVNSIVYVSDYEGDPKRALINKLEKMFRQIRELEKARVQTAHDSKSTDLIDTCITHDEPYLAKKQEFLKTRINEVVHQTCTRDSKVDSLEIFPGYFGNSQGYELRIKYSGDVFRSPTFKRSLGAETDYLCVREQISANLELDDLEPEASLGKLLAIAQPEEKTRRLSSASNSSANESQGSDRTFGWRLRAVYNWFNSGQQPKADESDRSSESSEHSNSPITSNEVPAVAEARVTSVPDTELERQAKLTKVIVKKFDSLTALLEFEINFLAEDDPRYLNEKAENAIAPAHS
jgi:hypothetical protein